jgi:hypothetical protein
MKKAVLIFVAVTIFGFTGKAQSEMLNRQL